MALLCSYVPAGSCTAGPQPGARELMAWYLGAYGDRGGLNSGIYNCRDIAGTGVMSLHGEGRAVDLGVRPYRAGWAGALADALRRHSRELGVQCIIWAGRIWSASYCDQGWRTYHGSNPHDDHLHVELSWDAARHLTAAKIEATIGGGSKTPPATDWSEELIMSLPTVRRGDRGAHVRRSQALLAANGHPPANSFRRDGTPDGIAGPGWEAACRKWQAANRVRNSVRDGRGDGIWGRWSWTHALTGRS